MEAAVAAAAIIKTLVQSPALPGSVFIATEISALRTQRLSQSHSEKKAAREKRPFVNHRNEVRGRLNQPETALTAASIRHESDAHEAQHHHRPS